MRRIKPVPGLAHSMIITPTINQPRNNSRVIPRPTLLIKTSVIIKPINKINQENRLNTQSLKTMPIMTRNAHNLLG